MSIHHPAEVSRAPPKRKRRLSIAIPASLTEDTPHLREKTYKIGLIGRASSIFRVEQIMIYFDKPRQDQVKDAELAAAILRYMDTPQYLRKALVEIEPQLRFVGILPPLRSPHHQLTRDLRNVKIGMLRQGVVVGHRDGYSIVDIGLGKTAFTHGSLPANRRVTVMLTKIDSEIEAAKLDEAEIRIYWGYNVTVTKLPLAESTRKFGFDLVVSTSRYGKSINEVFPKLQSVYERSKEILLVFGSPAEGLKDILAQEGVDLDEYADFDVNMIPNQGVETIRTEEAVCSSLSLLNLLG